MIKFGKGVVKFRIPILILAVLLLIPAGISYLNTRSNQQLDLFRRRLEDEQKLFNGIALSEDEIKLNQINQK